MHFGPRLMRRVEPFGTQTEEAGWLSATLAECPGVNSVKSIQPHGKGGYVAVMDFSMEQLDGFIEHLESAGWMSVF